MYGCIDNTRNSECSSCGMCCSDLLPISRAEIERIRRYMEQHYVKEQHNYMLAGGIDMFAEGIDLSCPFRDNVKRVCTIYEIRPAICRDYRCDHEKRPVDLSQQVFHQKNDLVSMRREFFGSGIDPAQQLKKALEVLHEAYSRSL